MAAAASSGVPDEVFVDKLFVDKPLGDLVPGGAHCLCVRSSAGSGIIVAEGQKRALELLHSYPPTGVDDLLVFYREKLPNGEFSRDLMCCVRVSIGSYGFTLRRYTDEKRVTFSPLTDRSLQMMTFNNYTVFHDFLGSVGSLRHQCIMLGKKLAPAAPVPAASSALAGAALASAVVPAPAPASAVVPARASAILGATPVPPGLSHSGLPGNVMFRSPLAWLYDHGFTITDVKAAVREQSGVRYIFFEPKQAGGVGLDICSFRNGYGFYCHSGKWPKMFGSVVLLPPDAVVAFAFERKNDPKRSMAIFYLRRGQVSWEGIFSNTEEEQMITVALPTLVEPLYPKEEPTYNPTEAYRRVVEALVLRYFLRRALAQKDEIPCSKEYATLGVSSRGTGNPNHVVFNLFCKSGEDLYSARFMVDLETLTLYRLLRKPGIGNEGLHEGLNGYDKIAILDDLTIPKLLSFLSNYAQALGLKNIQIVGNSSPAMVLPSVDAYVEAVLRSPDIGRKELGRLEDQAAPAAAASAAASSAAASVAAASVEVPTSLVPATTSVVEMRRYMDLVRSSSRGEADFATRVLQKAVEKGAPAEILLDPAWSSRLNELFLEIMRLSGGVEPPMNVAISLKASHARVTSTSVLVVLSDRKVEFVDGEAGLGRCVYLDGKAFEIFAGFSKIAIVLVLGDRQYLLKVEASRLAGNHDRYNRYSLRELPYKSGVLESQFSRLLPPFLDMREPMTSGEVAFPRRLMAEALRGAETAAGLLKLLGASPVEFRTLALGEERRSQAQSAAGGGLPSEAATAAMAGMAPYDGEGGAVPGAVPEAVPGAASGPASGALVFANKGPNNPGCAEARPPSPS